MKSPNVILTH